MSITAIIIAKNQVKNIQNCIKALGFADEVIVVDNNSDDKTPFLAKKMGAAVYTVAGLDFSYLRNFGKEKAKSDWLLYIDTDEKVTLSLASEIGKKINRKTDYSAYTVLRKNYFFGKPWPKLEEIVRLIKKDSLIGWHGIVHESPIVSGKIGKLSSPLLHYTHQDLSSMVEKTNKWSEIEAQLRFKSNHPQMQWWRFFKIMLGAFYRSFIREKGWKMGTLGLVESIYQSFSNFITYAKLWEKQNKSEIVSD